MTDSGRLIREWRAAQEPPVRLVDLAARLDTSKANLSRIENGRQPITDDILPALVRETRIPGRLLRPDLAALMDGPAEAAEAAP